MGGGWPWPGGGMGRTVGVPVGPTGIRVGSVGSREGCMWLGRLVGGRALSCTEIKQKGKLWFWILKARFNTFVRWLCSI